MYINRDKNPKMMHFNIDMTKWSPKDNELKFIWVIATLMCLKPNEKMGLIFFIIANYKKLLFVDHELLLSCYENVTYLRGEGMDPHCVFEKMAKSFTTAYMEIKENWFQGQVNYLSSYFHARMMHLWEDIMNNLYENPLIQLNMHSDYNQTSLGVITNQEYDEIVNNSMNLLSMLCTNCTLEVSIKNIMHQGTLKNLFPNLTLQESKF